MIVIARFWEHYDSIPSTHFENFICACALSVTYFFLSDFDLHFRSEFANASPWKQAIPVH